MPGAAAGGRSGGGPIGSGLSGKRWRHDHGFQPNLGIRIRARSDAAQIFRRDIGNPNDVRRHDDQVFLVHVFGIGFGGEIFQEGNLREPGPAARLFRIRSLDQTAENVDFAVLQAHVMLDLLGADYRLIDSADILGSRYRRDLDRELQADFVVFRVNARRHVDDHADVQILELRIHQWIHQARRTRRSDANACLEASGGYRHALANAQLGFLTIDHANLWIVDDSGLAVRQKSRGRCAGQRDAVIARPDGMKRIQRNAGGRGGRRSARS